MRTLLSIAMALIVMTAPMARSAPAARPAPLSVGPLSFTVLRTFDRFEVHLQLPPYANPFDPDQILVQGHFLSPSGKTATVEGFYFQDYTRRLEGGREVLTARGAPEWRVRFTPTEVGTWAYHITARDRNGERASPQKTFRSLPQEPDAHGFVRVAGLYFAFMDGTINFPVGENLAWPGADGTFGYDVWLRQLGRQHADYARIWLGAHRARPGDDPLVLERRRGRYDLGAAWRLDQVLRLAERTGIRLSFCAETFNALRIRPGPALWGDNPYNRRNGGFLVRPAEFFTDAKARALFKQRLRYMAARWGCSPSVFSWELMNEADLTEDFNVDAVRGWVTEMGQALRGFDPYAHPISVSFGGAEGEPAIDALPQVDYVQTHLYGSGDIAQALAVQLQFKAKKYAKPVLVSEVGASVHRAANERDADGIWLHDALWAPIFNGAAGTGMPWWWDSYVDAGNRYDAFGAVARFVRDVPFTAYAWTAPQVISVRWKEGQNLVRDDVLIAPPQAGWQIAPYNKAQSFEVLSNGMVTDPSRLSRILHGFSRKDLYNPTSFLVDYPVDGQFVVHVIDPPTAGAVLRISVDGRRAFEENFATHELAVPIEYRVKIGAGQHVVKIDNAGSGWLDVNYELPSYRRALRPNLRVSGLSAPQYGLIWIENLDHSWLRSALGKAVRPVPPTIVVLDGFDIGDYVVEEWNTQTGTSIPYEQRCVDRHIELRVPVVHSDIAYKIWRKP